MLVARGGLLRLIFSLIKPLYDMFWLLGWRCSKGAYGADRGDLEGGGKCMTIKNNYDYTGASRQAAYVDRLKDKGLKQAKFWAHPDDVAKIKDYAAKLVLERDAEMDLNK